MYHILSAAEASDWVKRAIGLFKLSSSPRQIRARNRFGDGKFLR